MDGSARAPLGFLPAPLRGTISLLLLAANTATCVLALFPLAVAKFALPVDAVRKRLDPLLNAIARAWISFNGAWIALAGNVRWVVSGVEGLSRKRWYLVEANHQSWVDIFVLQKALAGRIPMLKFFLKQELIWVPLIGPAWWALDFPFMRRHSEEFLRRHPERRGDDIAAIRRACAKFALIPTSVMNFLEGTRFTEEKRDADGSPYRHLLRPKAGGIALALGAMGERFHSLLDVTLFYPGGVPTFFQFLSGRLREVVVRVRELPIPGDLLHGDYSLDPDYRARVQQWVQELWAGKDRELEELGGGGRPPPRGSRGGGRRPKKHTPPILFFLPPPPPPNPPTHGRMAAENTRCPCSASPTSATCTSSPTRRPSGATCCSTSASPGTRTRSSSAAACTGVNTWSGCSRRRAPPPTTSS